MPAKLSSDHRREYETRHPATRETRTAAFPVPHDDVTRDARAATFALRRKAAKAAKVRQYRAAIMAAARARETARRRDVSKALQALDVFLTTPAAIKPAGTLLDALEGRYDQLRRERYELIMTMSHERDEPSWNLAPRMAVAATNVLHNRRWQGTSRAALADMRRSDGGEFVTPFQRDESGKARKSAKRVKPGEARAAKARAAAASRYRHDFTQG